MRGALKWAITDRLSITPSVYYQAIEAGGYVGLLAVAVRSERRLTSRTAMPSEIPAPIHSIWRRSKSIGMPAFASMTSNTSYISRNQHSISDYTQFDRALFGLTLPPPPGDLGTSHDADNQNNFYQEFRLQSLDPAATLVWTTGLFYSHLMRTRPRHVFDPNLNGEFNAAYGVPFCTPQAPCPNGEILTQPDIPDHRHGNTRCSAMPRSSHSIPGN